MRRETTCYQDLQTGVTYWRAHVWGPKGYSTKTFTNHNEARFWLPAVMRIKPT